ncbi:deoxyribonuclease-2-beta [Chanos chanos]|uniref:deoxyribonuclease II n=1 Tax=Chanos chanos TaxID=29144 RepID=A0A6J2W7F7_CHACN|nr:deoxyribonuclease-2-beta [Chanos chanos]
MVTPELLIFHQSRNILCKAQISCLNEDGQPVDWFIIYKLPTYREGSIGSGLDYMYLDPSVKTWQLSKFLINETHGALGNTLNQIYENYQSNSSTYAFYNDGPPVLKYYSNYGHTKGALHFDKLQGFWLIHSVPHFPPFPESGYGYPSTGKPYGQNALCITYRYAEFRQISRQFGYLNPRLYNCSVPVAFRSEMSSLAQLCEGETPALVTNRRLEKLVSAGGESFFSFAKSQNYVDDIYAAWVAQTLYTNLLAETWQHNIHGLPSNCSLPKHVMNIGRVKLPGPTVFRSYEDHSKWCVSSSDKNRWTCLGDLNRGSGQTKRGGGLVCTQNPVIYDAFRQAVAWYIGC